MNASGDSTPHSAVDGESGEESDAGDYEHVIGLIPGGETAGVKRGRANSYADQRLKNGKLTASLPLDERKTMGVEMDGLHLTQAYERKKRVRVEEAV